jgi:hypothetical protein
MTSLGESNNSEYPPGYCSGRCPKRYKYVYRVGSNSGLPSVTGNNVIANTFKESAINVVKRVEYRNKHMKLTKVVEIVKK